MKNIIRNWTNPIKRQWPLLVAYMVMIGWKTLLSNPYMHWFCTFLQAYLVVLLVDVTKSKVVKGLVYVLVFVLFLIQVMLENCYDLSISPSTLMLLAETNERETREFFSVLVSKPGFWLTLFETAVCIALTWYAEHRQTRLSAFLNQGRRGKALKWLSAFLLVGGIVASHCYVNLFSCKTVDEVSAWNMKFRHPSDPVTRVMIAFFDTHLAGKETELAVKVTREMVPAKTDETDSLHVILVIGESFIKQHSPIYGYYLNTTPCMLEEQRQGNLTVFTDVVSPNNRTTLAMRNLISCNSIASGERWSEKPALTAVFKSSGYYVSMFDNQRSFSFASTQTYALNNYLYNPKLLKACYDEVCPEVFDYDADLIAYYTKQRQPDHRLRLTIFHLMGQHFDTRERFPQDDARFTRFTADSIRRNDSWMTRKKRQEIADYDNSTLYNDYVMAQIFGLARGQNAVVVYVSDHGEEVFDYRDNSGRSNSKNLSDMVLYQNGVPLVVWCSEIYQQRHPDIVDRLKHAAHRPLMTDNVCQLLFHLAMMRHQPYYVAKRDVLSDHYDCGQRLLENQWDYDELQKNKVR